jgi:hypothetical protein
MYLRYQEGELKISPTEEYLLFLAYLSSTQLVEFRVPAKTSPLTPSIIAMNFDALVSVAAKITAVGERHQFPRIAITPTTSTLESLPHWIESWEQSYQAYVRGTENRELLDEMADLEVTLKKLSNPQSPNAVGRYNTTLAEWASKAFDFPHFLIEDNGKLITLANYWKLIIRSCQNQEKIFLFPKEDIIELRDHLLDYIEHAPKWGIDVLGVVEEGIELHSNFLGLGDIDLARGSTTYRCLTEEDTVQTANIEAIIQSAPKEEPREQDYPTRFAFLKAKMNYNLARNRGTSK